MSESPSTSPAPSSPPPLPGSGMDLRDPQVVADLFDQAAQANLDDRRRKGASIMLGSSGRLLITGDIHDNGNNFFKTIHLAALHESPRNHVILQEVIHGPHLMDGRDMSIRTLIRVAAYKVMYPEQVCLLQSNHELAQMLGSGIMKDGHSVTEAYDEGIDFMYRDGADQVREAMNRFIRSYPLCVRCSRGPVLRPQPARHCRHEAVRPDRDRPRPDRRRPAQQRLSV